jgi:hypothetical protein
MSKPITTRIKRKTSLGMVKSPTKLTVGSGGPEDKDTVDSPKTRTSKVEGSEKGTSVNLTETVSLENKAGAINESYKETTTRPESTSYRKAYEEADAKSPQGDYEEWKARAEAWNIKKYGTTNPTKEGKRDVVKKEKVVTKDPDITVENKEVEAVGDTRTRTTHSSYQTRQSGRKDIVEARQQNKMRRKADKKEARADRLKERAAKAEKGSARKAKLEKKESRVRDTGKAFGQAAENAKTRADYSRKSVEQGNIAPNMGTKDDTIRTSSETDAMNKNNAKRKKVVGIKTESKGLTEIKSSRPMASKVKTTVIGEKETPLAMKGSGLKKGYFKGK